MIDSLSHVTLSNPPILLPKWALLQKCCLLLDFSLSYCFYGLLMQREDLSYRLIPHTRLDIFTSIISIVMSHCIAASELQQACRLVCTKLILKHSSCLDVCMKYQPHYEFYCASSKIVNTPLCVCVFIMLLRNGMLFIADYYYS